MRPLVQPSDEPAQFGRSLPGKARQHSQVVRLGQTRRLVHRSHHRVGLTTGWPNQRRLDHHLDVKVEQSLFDRRVMSTFAHAMGTLEEIAVKRGKEPTGAELSDAVGDGVSRELCIGVIKALKSKVISDSLNRVSMGPCYCSSVWCAQSGRFSRRSINLAYEGGRAPAHSRHAKARRSLRSGDRVAAPPLRSHPSGRSRSPGRKARADGLLESHTRAVRGCARLPRPRKSAGARPTPRTMGFAPRGIGLLRPRRSPRHGSPRSAGDARRGKCAN